MVQPLTPCFTSVCVRKSGMRERERERERDREDTGEDVLGWVDVKTYLLRQGLQSLKTNQETKNTSKHFPRIPAHSFTVCPLSIHPLMK